MLEARVLDSLAQVEREQWTALFPGEVEDYDYLTAVELAGLDGFRWRYVLVSEGERILAAAPAFLTEYPLETTLSGAGRRLADSLRRRFPDALTLRLACIGSPCTEQAQIGLARDLSVSDRDAVVTCLLQAFEAEARRERCGLLGLKDVAAPDRAILEPSAEALGYCPLPSLPIAHLDIDFSDLDTYLARLSSSARKEMRRKLRVRDQVRIEVRDDVTDLIEAIMPLYAQTRARAEMTFEDLTAGYFTGVGQRMPGRCVYVLYYDGDDLLAVNLLLQGEDTLIDKFFCMDRERGRALNLYFLSWFTNLQLCLERGLKRYQAGQAAYPAKIRLGSQLTRTANYFRHRNVLVNSALRLAAPLFAADPTLQEAA